MQNMALSLTCANTLACLSTIESLALQTLVLFLPLFNIVVLSTSTRSSMKYEWSTKSLLCFQSFCKLSNVFISPKRSSLLQLQSKMKRCKWSTWIISWRMYQIQICLFLLMRLPKINGHLPIYMDNQWEVFAVLSRGTLFVEQGILLFLPSPWMILLHTTSSRDQLMVNVSWNFWRNMW